MYMYHIYPSNEEVFLPSEVLTFQQKFKKCQPTSSIFSLVFILVQSKPITLNDDSSDWNSNRKGYCCYWLTRRIGGGQGGADSPPPLHFLGTLEFHSCITSEQHSKLPDFSYNSKNFFYPRWGGGIFFYCRVRIDYRVSEVRCKILT